MKFEIDFQQQQGIAIQSSGALLAFRTTDDKVALASANCAQFLGEAGDNALGQSVRDVVGCDVFHALRNVSVLPSIRKRREYIGRYTFNDRPLDLSAIQSGDCIVIEAFDADPDPFPSAYDVLKDVLLIQDRIQTAKDENDVFCNIITLLRTISGYDCVAVCKYLENKSEIVAKSGNSIAAFETLEVSTQLHIVPSVDQEAVQVHSLSDVDKFDLGLSGLRWPPTPSLEKLRRVGAAACVTQGVQLDDRIWGYLTFLHRSPRVPNHRTRLALSHLQPLICAKLSSFTA